MKHLIPLTTLAALSAASPIYAQTPAFSKPSGYVTQDLIANQINLVGISLHNSPMTSGEIDAVSGNLLTDTGASMAPVANRLYVFEVLDGPLAGTIQEVSSSDISATTITTPEDLGTLGLTVGVKYSIRLAPTLEEIFGTSASSVLTRALNSNTADIVWIPDGSGNYTKYFIHSTTSAFRIAGTTTPAPNVPVVYADGILVQKRNVTSTLTITGQVKTTGTNTVVAPGFTPISLVSPVGVTLFNSGLADDLKAALNSNTADIVWVPQSNATFVKYFRHSSSGGTWRDVSDPNTVLSVDVDLPPTVYIQRKGSTSANIKLDVPASYDQL